MASAGPARAPPDHQNAKNTDDGTVESHVDGWSLEAGSWKLEAPGSRAQGTVAVHVPVPGANPTDILAGWY